MDKYEYKLKLDQMKSLAAEHDYETAAEIADSINWQKIKNINALVKVGEIYAKSGRYEESREILLVAYDRSPIGRTIIYRLAKIAVKMGNIDEAKDYYQEFVEIAPHDNLKYALRYEIAKAGNSDLDVLIGILEELKEQEYSEEWAFELAHLYHAAGMSEKCVEACDELILWFGDGPFVERALELKMLHQPLNRAQEDKYRMFRQKSNGIVEVMPEDELESGEIVNEPVQIPKVKLSPERFNTQNLQEELQRSMQQIMEATERETVDDSMDNIKKLVEEIPYLQCPKEEPIYEGELQELHIQTDEEIDNSLKINFQEMLAEDGDGQFSLYVPDFGGKEPQVNGQMSIEEVLDEWERTKRAAEAALQEAETRKLESAKARALQEAGDIMGRLAEIIPKLDSGLTPKDLLDEQYLAGEPIEDDRAAKMVANMNQILQQEIERLSVENEQIDQKLAEAAGIADGLAAVAADEIAEYEAEQMGAGVRELLPVESEDTEPDVFVPEVTVFAEEPEYLEVLEGLKKSEDLEVTETVEDFETVILEEAERSFAREAIERQDKEILPEISLPEEMNTDAEEKERKQILPEISAPEEEVEITDITSLSKEQREIFTYFVPIKGMEQQLCQALTGASRHLQKSKNGSLGSMIIQGGKGSGKTVLATSMVKALQKEIGKPNGRIGKIEASVLNQKDVAALFKKVAGGCLIIEKAGNLSKETAVKMGLLLQNDTSGLFLIIEDTKKGIEKALGKDSAFAARFSEKINIPIFTSDELVEFAKVYANELGYTIDEMGVLALYNSISNIQKLDEATTLTEVKEIVDGAITRAERGVFKKAFGMLASRRYDDQDYIILHEKDFGF